MSFAQSGCVRGQHFDNDVCEVAPLVENDDCGYTPQSQKCVAIVEHDKI